MLDIEAAKFDWSLKQSLRQSLRQHQQDSNWRYRDSKRFSDGFSLVKGYAASKIELETPKFGFGKLNTNDKKPGIFIFQTRPIKGISKFLTFKLVFQLIKL